MMAKSLKILIFSLFLLSLPFFSPVQAQSNQWLNRAQEGGLEEIGQTAFDQTGEPRPLALTVASILRIFLGFLGIIFVILIIMAGFRWMTAGGNEENIKKATAQIRNACIGLIIILAAYALTVFVQKQIITAVSNNTIFH